MSSSCPHVMECRVELLNTWTARDPDRHVAKQKFSKYTVSILILILSYDN